MDRAERDRGFTLVELLVVMVVVGLLAAIAVPIFLTQRQKARDTAVKSDVTNVGKEIATYYVDNANSLAGTVDVAGGVVTLKDGATTVTTIDLTGGTTCASGCTYNSTNVVTYLSGGTCTTATGWYVTLWNPDGAQKTWYYSAQSGLSTTAPTACV